MDRLKGRVAIVTGGAQGIGEAIARRFAREGAAVALADINAGLAQDVAEAIAAEHGTRTFAVEMDVADRGAVDAGVAEVAATLGQPDILVNNAGIALFREPLETSDDDWRRCMAIDLEGSWHCARAVLPGMLAAGRGNIVNIISNHAFTIIPSTFPYPVAKHGLLGLTRALGLEYAGRGICVNAISPGYVDTEINAKIFAAAPDPAAARAEVEAKQPPGRLCHPDEVAAVAALLASDEARFIIGENIVIDGGVSIRMYEQG